MLPLERDSWFAVQVTPRHETKVATILQHKNYGHFLPMCSTRRNWSDRVKISEQPLFPGYVFVRSCLSAVGKIRGTPGIIRIVSFGAKPCPIPDDQIETLQQVIESKRKINCCSYLTMGRQVQIIGGPLSGVTGIVIQLRNRRHLVVSVDLITKSVMVEIDGFQVAPLGPFPSDDLGGSMQEGLNCRRGYLQCLNESVKEENNADSTGERPCRPLV